MSGAAPCADVIESGTDDTAATTQRVTSAAVLYGVDRLTTAQITRDLFRIDATERPDIRGNARGERMTQA